MKPDGEGIVRFSVDVTVLGHTDAIDASGRIGRKDSQHYFSIDARGDTFYGEGALHPGGTIPDPTVVAHGRPGGRASKQYQQVWDFTKTKPAGHWLSGPARCRERGTSSERSAGGAPNWFTSASSTRTPGLGRELEMSTTEHMPCGSFLHHQSWM